MTRDVVPLGRFLFSLALLANAAAIHVRDANSGPWDLRALNQPPRAEWGARTGLVQEVYYEGERLEGRPTRVFAYVGRPANSAAAAARLPGMVLVHGGGGKAFADWAKHWAERGYVAIAMDLSGNGPTGRLPDGAPDQSDQSKFREFIEPDARDMWTYHAVADVVRAHSLLLSLPETDRQRTGLTGISWGGYLTCIVAGLDHRFRVAVPVYGCGFLGDNSYWKDKSLAAMSPAARERWLQLFDPGQYLGGVSCPILFLNGTTDFAYPLDSYQKSYRRVPSKRRTVSTIIDLPHGHIWTFPEVDSFVAASLRKAEPYPQVTSLQSPPGELAATVKAKMVAKAELCYSTDTGEWQKRRWQSTSAEISRAGDGWRVKARLPEQRPIVAFLLCTDGHGLRVSSEHVEVP
jgi:dienelactone hydrolase